MGTKARGTRECADESPTRPHFVRVAYGDGLNVIIRSDFSPGSIRRPGHPPRFVQAERGLEGESDDVGHARGQFHIPSHMDRELRMIMMIGLGHDNRGT